MNRYHTLGHGWSWLREGEFVLSISNPSRLPLLAWRVTRWRITGFRGGRSP